MTNLKPEVGNATRWTSWGGMMIKHGKMKEHLREGSLLDNNTIQADQSWEFQKNSIKVTKMFKDINMTTVSLQTKLYPLKNVCENFNSLVEESKQGHENAASAWFR